MDETTNTIKTFLSKQPALRYLYEPIADTIIFNTSEVGFIETTGKDSNARIAKYPDAPAWPTVE